MSSDVRQDLAGLQSALLKSDSLEQFLHELAPRSSIVSRAVIDQALGVIMASERCPQDRAFAILRSVSQNKNIKLRDLAATIVASVSGEPPGLAAPVEAG